VKLIKQGVSSGDERDLCGDLTVISRKSRQTVTVRHEKTVDQSSVADYPSELDRETPELIWVKCSHPVVVPTGLETALKTVGYDVHCGQQAPAKDVASSIIYCPTEEDVGLEVRFLRALFQDALILVFCADADPECVLAALRAGAHGFTWRQPAETICALSKGSEKDVVVTKGLLEALLRERASHNEDYLSPRQREITFELAITASMSSEGALWLPKKLLEAFVREVIIA
jgi:DNA-binding NarL/FixJ family response regulator